MLQISGSSMQMRMLPMIKDYFAAAGIDMKLQIVEWSVLLERLNKRQFEACNLGWTGSIDPDPYQIFHSSQASADGDNFVSLKNAELDKAIEDLRREFDMDKRIALARKIEKIIHEEQPYTFMFYSDALVVVSGDYENVKVFPQGLEPLSFYMKKEALK
jgi:peptide/nickel transport system substrate-binding protein